MELTGPAGILFWVGLLMFGIGNALAWTMISKYGGLDRTKTLFVVFDDESPMKAPSAKADRWRFRVGVYLIGFGLVTFYTGMSTGELRELQVCRRECQKAGYWGGAFAPSQQASSASSVPTPALGPYGPSPNRACWCASPQGSVELPPESLR